MIFLGHNCATGCCITYREMVHRTCTECEIPGRTGRRHFLLLFFLWESLLFFLWEVDKHIKNHRYRRGNIACQSGPRQGWAEVMSCRGREKHGHCQGFVALWKDVYAGIGTHRVLANIMHWWLTRIGRPEFKERCVAHPVDFHGAQCLGNNMFFERHSFSCL